MEKIVINGGIPLTGTVEVSGMKNAALPIIFACILVEEDCIIENIPDIADVRVAFEILKHMGVKVERLDTTSYKINAKDIKCGTSPDNLVSKMRASYYLLGCELGRFGRSHICYPGGCDIGSRPIDQHVKGFEALGATVTTDMPYIDAVAKQGLHGASIYFDLVTVGGTINVMLAATLAEGMTIIENAAREPQIVDLANFLNMCGAKITGAGTDTIKIKGVKRLNGCMYEIIPDMIEAGTYMVAAAATEGNLKITNVIPKHLESVSAKLREMGVNVEEGDDYVIVSRNGPLNKVNIKTLPYPGFPTDMQAQMSILLCLADGVSYLNESVFDNRFRYVDELRRMGANVKVEGKTAIFEGRTSLKPAKVRALDLRAGAAMIIAGLCTNGITEIEDIHYIERGYDNVVGKLQKVGARIGKVTFPDPPVTI